MRAMLARSGQRLRALASKLARNPFRRGRGAAGAPEAAVVEPPRRPDAEKILRRLEWTVIRRLDGLLQGDYRTLFRGVGLDLADLREYQPHDDVRYIDWNVTARLQTPHVREFQEDREVAAWFLLDLSGSVNFGSEAIAKRTLSSEFVTVIARLLTRFGNRVGAVMYSDGTTDAVIPARGGRRHVLHLLDRMIKVNEHRSAANGVNEHRSAANGVNEHRSAAHGVNEHRSAAQGVNEHKPGTPADSEGAGRETDLAELLARAQRVIKRRSVIFVVSDFISKPGWGRALSLLARRHEVVAIRLYDPMEVKLPDLGMIVLQDAETGEQLFVDTHDGAFRKRFAKAAEEREATLRSSLAEAGVDCLELATDADLAESLLRFTKLRKRRSQLAAGVSRMVAV